MLPESALRRSRDRSFCRNAMPDYSSMNVKELKVPSNSFMGLRLNLRGPKNLKGAGTLESPYKMR